MRDCKHFWQWQAAWSGFKASDAGSVTLLSESVFMGVYCELETPKTNNYEEIPATMPGYNAIACPNVV